MDVSELLPRDGTSASGSAAAVSRALAALPDGELLRLGALARLRARGLPADMSWTDLLHEALARALDGSRQWPPHVPLLTFLAGVMRSIAGEIWRQRRREASILALGTNPDSERHEVACPAADQERVLAAGEAIAMLYRLFAGDDVALRIIAGHANGLSAAEIRTLYELSPVAYDSARRRMRRALLRAGLVDGSR
jgi:DNA-directed RNA polymerase specialized sigma24 family protein